ncbi:hypothetical protein IWX49DRAFT_594823 [Phyllosticta citricarpa]
MTLSRTSPCSSIKPRLTAEKAAYDDLVKLYERLFSPATEPGLKEAAGAAETEAARLRGVYLMWCNRKLEAYYRLRMAKIHQCWA